MILFSPSKNGSRNLSQACVPFVCSLHLALFFKMQIFAHQFPPKKAVAEWAVIFPG